LRIPEAIFSNPQKRKEKEKKDRNQIIFAHETRSTSQKSPQISIPIDISALTHMRISSASQNSQWQVERSKKKARNPKEAK
jgi:hypothetical protein